MKKLESTFGNMVLVLGGITVFAAGSLGLVNELTKESIKKAEQTALEAAIKLVTPDFDNSPIDEKYYLFSEDSDSILCFPAKKDNKLIGVALDSYTDKGYGGIIKVMVGFDPNGVIINYSVLSHKETPGLGSKMVDWFRTKKNNQNIIGRNPGKDKLFVSKDGGEVDAITAATISSRAFLDAIDRAYRAYMKSREVDLDAKSDAFDQKTDSVYPDGVSSASAEHSTIEEKGVTNEK